MIIFNIDEQLVPENMALAFEIVWLSGLEPNILPLPVSRIRYIYFRYAEASRGIIVDANEQLVLENMGLAVETVLLSVLEADILLLPVSGPIYPLPV